MNWFHLIPGTVLRVQRWQRPGPCFQATHQANGFEGRDRDETPTFSCKSSIFTAFACWSLHRKFGPLLWIVLCSLSQPVCVAFIKLYWVHLASDSTHCRPLQSKRDHDELSVINWKPDWVYRSHRSFLSPSLQASAVGSQPWASCCCCIAPPPLVWLISSATCTSKKPQLFPGVLTLMAQP